MGQRLRKFGPEAISNGPKAVKPGSETGSTVHPEAVVKWVKYSETCQYVHP
jgi:hypothetical protein